MSGTILLGSDDHALAVLESSDDENVIRAAAVFLEVSLNGGDPGTVLRLALALLGIAENLAQRDAAGNRP